MSFATHCECLCQAYTCKVCGYSRREGFGHSTAHAAGAQLLPLIAERACNTDSRFRTHLAFCCSAASLTLLSASGMGGSSTSPLRAAAPSAEHTDSWPQHPAMQGGPVRPTATRGTLQPQSCRSRQQETASCRTPLEGTPTNGARVHHRDVRHSHSCLRCTGATAWEAARGHRPAVPLCAVRSQCSCAGARMQASGELHGHTTWQRRHVR